MNYLHNDQNLHGNKSYSNTFLNTAAIIFCVACLLRLLLFLLYLTRDPVAFSRSFDTANYVNAAKNMLWYGVFCEQEAHPPYPGIFRTPGYPAFLAGIYYVSGFSNAAVVLVQVSLSSLSCVMVYGIASKYAARWAAAAALILAVDIAAIKGANEIMTETLFTTFVLAAVYAFSRFFDTAKARFLFFAAGACAAGAYVRPILLYFFIIVPLAIGFHFRRNYRMAVRYSAFFIAVFALLISPWLYRNYSLGYRGFSAVQEVNIFAFKAGWIEDRLQGVENKDVIDFDGRYRKVDMLLVERGIANTPYNRVKLYRELGMKTIKENPLLALKYQLVYSARVFTTTGAEVVLSEIYGLLPFSVPAPVSRLLTFGYRLLLYASYLLLTAGAFSRSLWSNFRGGIIVALLLVYLAVLSGEWGAESRFRIPIMPLILIISAGSMEILWSYVRNILRIKVQS